VHYPYHSFEAFKIEVGQKVIKAKMAIFYVIHPTTKIKKNKTLMVFLTYVPLDTRFRVANQ